MKSEDFVRQSYTRLILGTLLAILIIVGFLLRKAGYISDDTFFMFFEKQYNLAPVLFVISYSIMLIFFLPTLSLPIVAGFLWGPFWGTAFSIIGAMIGSSLAFLIGRYISRDYFIKRLDFTPWKWLLEKVDKDGWKIVAFTRMIPVFPTAIINYLFGLTSITFLEYLWSTFVFLLPPVVAFVAFGSSIREFVLMGNITKIISGILIALLLMLILFGLKPFFNKMLCKKG